MKAQTRARLAMAYAVCIHEDRSTEYMIQFMMDVAGVDHDCVVNFITQQPGWERADATTTDL